MEIFYLVEADEDEDRFVRCRSLGSLAVRAGLALASLDTVLEEAVVWELIFDFTDDLQHHRIVKLWLPGQNPEEVEGGHAEEVRARVDDGVCVVVRVEDVVVGLVAG